MGERPAFVEVVHDDSQVLCYVIRAAAGPSETTFVTAEEENLQLGFVVYPRGGEIAAHKHLPLERRLMGTAEVLLVRAGRCEVDLYDSETRLVATKILETDDVLLLTGEGGHGFRMLEDTILLEVKQGPYFGMAEKEPL